MLTLSPTLHHSNWILHSGPKDIGSKHSGQILNTHLIFIGVRLNLIQKPEQTESKAERISTHVKSSVLTALLKIGRNPLFLFYSVKWMKRSTESWFWLVCGLCWWSLYRCRRQRRHAIIHTQSQSMWCHFPWWRGCGWNECYFSCMTGWQILNHRTVYGK